MKQIILDLQKEPDRRIEISEDTEILGLFVAHNKEEFHGSLEVIHKRPQLKSLTKIKAVVYDKATFDMTGNLIIEKGAKYTDAYLRIDALMMSTEAKARAVPSLEITENDVKGGHGATVGQVNAEQLFYLRARGLSAQAAEAMLVQGFVQDLLDMIRDDKALQTLQKLV